MPHLKFYTIQVNKTGALRYALADNAQHACAVFNLWVGVCTILRIEELPSPIKAVALPFPAQFNSATDYRGEQKLT